MSRCKACDKILSESELRRKDYNTDDYLDLCYHHPETADLFMLTNTYMQIVSPSYLFTDNHGKIVINYVHLKSSTCDKVENNPFKS